MTHRGPFQPLLFCDSVGWWVGTTVSCPVRRVVAGVPSAPPAPQGNAAGLSSLAAGCTQRDAKAYRNIPSRYSHHLVNLSSLFFFLFSSPPHPPQRCSGLLLPLASSWGFCPCPRGRLGSPEGRAQPRWVAGGDLPALRVPVVPCSGTRSLFLPSSRRPRGPKASARVPSRDNRDLLLQIRVHFAPRSLSNNYLP